MGRRQSGLLHAAAVVLVCVLGYWAPWDLLLHLDGTGPNAHLWGVLAVALSKAGLLGISTAFDGLLALGIALAVIAAGLRTLGEVRGHARAMAWGTTLHVCALGLLMPVSGAVFAVVLVAVLEVWLLRAGERGAAMPWGYAVLREVYAWGVAGSFAVAGWGYNAELLVRCVLVAFGVGLVVRGLLPGAAVAHHGSTHAPLA